MTTNTFQKIAIAATLTVGVGFTGVVKAGCAYAAIWHAADSYKVELALKELKPFLEKNVSLASCRKIGDAFKAKYHPAEFRTYQSKGENGRVFGRAGTKGTSAQQTNAWKSGTKNSNMPNGMSFYISFSDASEAQKDDKLYVAKYGLLARGRGFSDGGMSEYVGDPINNVASPAALTFPYN